MIGLFKDNVNQTRKPAGFMEKMMLTGMDFGHVKLSDWGFKKLPVLMPQGIVDPGCGGRRNVGKLLKNYPKEIATGLDYSPLSVKKARLPM